MNIIELSKLVRSKSSPEKMPVLFLGHGSPMNAIEENEFVKGFRSISETLPKPTSILCISAHWYTKGSFITSMPMPRTIHDFGGFPAELYNVQYPVKGNPELAKETKKLVDKTEIGLDETWGLDHGAWSVIKHLYPKADVPVIQLSIDYSKPPLYHFELARQLSILRKRGVLIIGSGNIIHNLRLVDFYNFNKDNYGFDWAIEAQTIINKLISNGDFLPLFNYESLGEAIRLAIPTPEHFLPLIYTLGLKDINDTITLFNDKLLGGSLSMTCVRIDQKT
ncbi:MAG: 4,5-DOPA dioxygenase extradiol [Bacteroidetes bacterium GWF2_33_16]|nr:MAG: 4,5-DOPA dioxygenase extradiol [Bacteroidetes bacterium GWE2_32_14]OFY08748.1 MAG: 4,5-DOPA dioxygenase extradiol [Bacteroidetes bacterium GWF2_33_16]